MTRVDLPGRPSLSLFEVRRRGPGPLLVSGSSATPFHRKDEPPVAFDWPWPARATAVDALGQAPPRRRPPASPSIAASG